MAGWAGEGRPSPAIFIWFLPQVVPEVVLPEFGGLVDVAKRDGSGAIIPGVVVPSAQLLLALVGQVIQ